ncbi:hypothetical protein AVEN_267726-1 [Araneus ventricosus]|uniref:Uncharacterized protein n=1 Tax=Araneus ventricosus TaxID=182803 RepID=A0A4Y2CVD9_ARAVE|nr:hypothetical protein AVEN_267726-1 [Araneus ventricosus]
MRSKRMVNVWFHCEINERERVKEIQGLFWDFVILNCGQMTRTTHELAPSSNFHTTPAGGHLICSRRPNTQQIFSGIGFRTRPNPRCRKPRLYHQADRARQTKR